MNEFDPDRMRQALSAEDYPDEPARDDTDGPIAQPVHRQGPRPRTENPVAEERKEEESKLLAAEVVGALLDTPEQRQAALMHRLGLVFGSDLEERAPGKGELGFWVDGTYRGMEILDLPAQDPRHAYLFDPATAPTGTVRSFYVRSPEGALGLVPWPGATPIWPAEKAWEQDLYHQQSEPAKKAYYETYIKSREKAPPKKAKTRRR